MSTDDELTAIREATRQLHETIKEARQVQKELAAVLPDLVGSITDSLNDIIFAAAEKQMEGLIAVIDQTKRDIYERFNKIADVLMGETKSRKRKGEPGMVELAAMIRQINTE